ncbi:hypothetical protein BDP55DRAFT_626713 [Colletotrichum godetiae]|uniref:Uncharacterized protein n=1 Tax=Colletotrichum godetiae TaxID=1209918 RepID=A0AAJ0AXH6_9PEZI|nr:uncharacterized protein BDP55DRAFT_626713 [Colletotrichum godetiae]KAK1700053.1 hypothetical protein BDP55DRAFT_626713 [Colletotrichum godetiae]
MGGNGMERRGWRQLPDRTELSTWSFPEWLPSGGRKGSPTIPRLPASPSITPALIGHSSGTIYSRPRPSNLAQLGEEQVSRTFYPDKLMSIGQPRGNIGDGPYAFLSKVQNVSSLEAAPRNPVHWCRFLLAEGGPLGGRHQGVIGLIWQSPGLVSPGRPPLASPWDASPKFPRVFGGRVRSGVGQIDVPAQL